MEEETQTKIKVEYRIGIISIIIFGAMGILADLLEIAADLISFGMLGTIKDIIVFVLLPAVFSIKGVPFWKGKNANKNIWIFGVASVISFIPYLSTAMPETFFEVLAIMLLSRKEDRELFESLKDEESSNSNITRYRRVYGSSRGNASSSGESVNRRTPPPLPNNRSNANSNITRAARRIVR